MYHGREESMSDLPNHMLQQQSDARPVSGEQLEVLGKKAASRYAEGTSLNEAVVETVKQAGLSPEQVKRVVEFANTAAYLNEFKKEGSSKAIEFDGGPADPSEVLKDLNDGGGGSVHDPARSDYGNPPDVVIKLGAARKKQAWAEHMMPGTEGYHSDRMRSVLEGLPANVFTPEAAERDLAEAMGKTASAEDLEGYLLEEAAKEEPKAASVHHREAEFWEMFGEEKGAEPYVNPAGPLIELKQKLAAAHDQVNSELTSLEVDYVGATDQMYAEVKQAALGGTTLGNVVAAWSGVAPNPEYVKAAFQLMTPRLQQEGVFASPDEITASIEKVASVDRIVNTKHPLVETFGTFCATLNKMASLREFKKDVDEGLGQTELLLKKAFQVGGALGKALEVGGKATRATGEAAGRVAEKAVGADPKAVAEATRKGLNIAGGGTLGLGGLAAFQEIADRPTTRAVAGAYKSLVPGTQEYNMRRYRLMTGQG
jgi:hypothetical protein